MATRRSPLQVADAADKKGNHAKAVEAYGEHLSTHPDDARVLLRVGELLERLEEPAGAAEAFKKLGELHLKEGFSAKAVSVLRRAFKLMPEDVPSAMLLGQALANDGRKRDATEVLETAAKSAEARVDRAGRVRLLRSAAELDGSVRTSLALADVLAEGDTKSAALTVLKNVVIKLKEENALNDQVRVQERLLELAPDDAEVGLEAAQGALTLREPTRSLLIVRRALDGHPEDVRLVQMAAVGLEAFGDESRAARVYREAARIHSDSGEETKARECWGAILRLVPDDAEAKRILQPGVQLPPASDKKGKALDSDELDDALSVLTESRKRQFPGDDTFDVDLESVGKDSIEVDQIPPQTPLRGTPTEQLLEVTFEDEPPQPPPLPKHRTAAAPKAPPVATKPQRALVLGHDAEAAWASSGLLEQGMDVVGLGLDELGSAVERALQTRRDLIFAPGPLQEGWVQPGRDWKVAGAVFMDRHKAASLAKSAKLPVVDAMPVRTPTDLEKAFSNWGAPLELAGTYGKTIKLASPVGAAFQLALARQQLGADLTVQRWLPERIWVLVASDGNEVKALGEFSTTMLEDVPVFLSTQADGEKERLELAEGLAQAMGIKGTAVLCLAGESGKFAFESFLPRWGPGALAVEVRLGVSLVGLSLDLARGLNVPPRLEPRGAACAAEVAATALSSVANLRVESGKDGMSYACAQGPDAEQALKKLGRVLKSTQRPLRSP